MENKIMQEVLKYAISTAIFCKTAGCGQILDLKTAVLLTDTKSGAEGIGCTKCFSDEQQEKAARMGLEVLTHKGYREVTK